jgi:hypothetical protein
MEKGKKCKEKDTEKLGDIYIEVILVKNVLGEGRWGHGVGIYICGCK